MSLAALLLLLAAAAPRAASAVAPPTGAGISTAQGPQYIGVQTPDEAELVQQFISAATLASQSLVDGTPLPTEAVIASSVAPNVSASRATQLLGEVLAAAVIPTESSLGDPSRQDYPE